MKAQIDKTDRNDARGMAQMMRVGLSSGTCEDATQSELRMLLIHRKLLQSKAIAIENDLRGTLRNFGLKVGMVGTGRVEAGIRKSWSRMCPTWPCWSNRCWSSGGRFASSSSSCIAACWPSFGTMKCAVA